MQGDIGYVGGPAIVNLLQPARGAISESVFWNFAMQDVSRRRIESNQVAYSGFFDATLDIVE